MFSREPTASAGSSRSKSISTQSREDAKQRKGMSGCFVAMGAEPVDEKEDSANEHQWQTENARRILSNHSIECLANLRVLCTANVSLLF
ncbi:MAG: hypothetical protein WED34_07690, partial [Planctomycetales bacterium]